jgi:hypothetical protein
MKNAKTILLLFILSCSVVYAQETGADTNQQAISIDKPIMQEDYRAVLPADGLNSIPFDVLMEWEEILKIREKRLAKKKVIRLIETFAAHRGSDGELTRASFLPYAEDLVDYCYYIAEVNNDPRFAHTWYWALVYGMANFGLTCYGVAPGNCAGPFDVKKYPLVRDPIKNMQHHVQEQYTGWKKGYRGIELCHYVMLPANPRDWGNRYRRDYYTNERLGHMKQFEYWHYTFSRCIKRGYEVGKLQ